MWLYLFIDSLRSVRYEDRIPVGATFFTPVQTGPRVHLTSCTMKNASVFRGVNVLEFYINHPTATSAEVKERVELHLYSSYCSSWSIPERNLPFTLHLCASLTVGFLQMKKVMKC